MDGLFDWLGSGISSLFGGGGSGSLPFGYGTLTPDQQQMVTQQGWYPRPDMVLPTGQSLTQPAGYSNLTPAQASTVDSLGYFTNPDAQQPDSLWGKIAKGLGSPGGQDAIKQLQSGLQGMTPRPASPAQPPPGLLAHGTPNPYRNLYTPTLLDPKQALQRFQRGY